MTRNDAKGIYIRVKIKSNLSKGECFNLRFLVFSFSLYTLNQLIKIGKGKIYRIVLKNNKKNEYVHWNVKNCGYYLSKFLDELY